MRIKEIIDIMEMPVDVKQDDYPWSKQDLSRFNLRDTRRFVKVLQKGKFLVYGDDLGGYGPPDLSAGDTFSAYVFAVTRSVQGMDPEVFGQIMLTSGQIGRGIGDVYIAPKYRNKGLGKFMYKTLILDLGIKLETAMALTPSSNRIWNSLFKDPQINVFAISSSEGHDHHAAGDRPAWAPLLPKLERFDDITFDGKFLQIKGEHRSKLNFVAEPANS